MVFVFLIFSAVLFPGCEYGIWEGFYRPNGVYERVQNLVDIDDSETENLVSSIAGKTYSFLVVSDIHCGKSEQSRENVDRLLHWLGLRVDIPDFCVTLGDSADHGRADEMDTYLELERRLKDFGVKNVYNVLGNHDLYNSGWNAWKEKMYPHTSFYRFSTGKISYYFLDTASGSLGKKQMELLRSAMEADGLPKFVFTHYPVYSDVNLGFCGLQESTEGDLLMDLFHKNNVVQVVEGHTHVYGEKDFPHYKEVNAPSLYKEANWLLYTVNEQSMEISYRVVRSGFLSLP